MERIRGIALWRQIYQAIRDEIRQGVYPPGARLPTEEALAAQYQVNRHTLRRAMAALRDDGVLRIEQGRGTFVQEEVVPYQVSKRTRFSENIASLDRQPGGRLIRMAEVPADAMAARELGVREGKPLLLLEILNVADDRPISIASHYFPLPRFKQLADAYKERGSITRALFSLGVKDYFRRVTRVRPKLPSLDDARLLQQGRSEPILYSENVNEDPDGLPIEFARTRYAGQRVELVFEP